MEKTVGQMNGEGKATYVEYDVWSGLTKREHFASMAMQGLLAKHNGGMTSGGTMTFSPSGISELAVLHADALLEALSNFKK